MCGIKDLEELMDDEIYDGVADAEDVEDEEEDEDE